MVPTQQLGNSETKCCKQEKAYFLSQHCLTTTKIREWKDLATNWDSLILSYIWTSFVRGSKDDQIFLKVRFLQHTFRISCLERLGGPVIYLLFQRKDTKEPQIWWMNHYSAVLQYVGTVFPSAEIIPRANYVIFLPLGVCFSPH